MLPSDVKDQRNVMTLRRIPRTLSPHPQIIDVYDIHDTMLWHLCTQALFSLYRTGSHPSSQSCFFAEQLLYFGLIKKLALAEFLRWLAVTDGSKVEDLCYS